MTDQGNDPRQQAGGTGEPPVPPATPPRSPASEPTRDADIFMYIRKLKRGLVLWRVLTVVALIALVVVAIKAPVLDDNGTKDRIARLDVVDVILSDRYRIEAVDRALENPHVKALVLRINSPGGSFVGGESLYNALRRFSEKKPVVVVMADMATSAGYMIALPAHRIFASQGTLTGSIGVILQMAEITQLLEKLGITPVIVKSAPLKASPNPFEATSDQARQAIEAVIKDSFEIFVDMVVDSRELSREQVVPLADGRIFTGRQALQNGLIDALGTEDDAVAWLVENRQIEEGLEVRDLKIDYPDKDWEEWLDSAASMFQRLDSARMGGLISIWRAEIYEK